MTAEPDLVLFHIPQSRSLTALWMLEELGLPYRIRTLDIGANEQRGHDYRRVNPSGKVPALGDGNSVVTERGAICTYLADRYAPGRLAPAIDAPDRGAYLAWMFYAAGVMEPLLALDYLKLEIEAPPGALAWGDKQTMIDVLAAALAGKDYLLGDRFTAADVFAGSMLIWGRAVGAVPDIEPLAGYMKRLTARPAYARTAIADGTR